MKKESKVVLEKFNPKQGLNRGASKFKEAIWYIAKVVFFQSALPYPMFLKVNLLRIFGAKIGKNIVVKPKVNIHFPWKLEIGNNVWIGEEVFLLNFEKVVIGNDVCISQRVFLCGGNHNYKDPTMSYRNGPIILNDGCWIGADTFVSPNVEIGVDAVIVAKSLINKSIPDNCIYGGNPAIFLKYRW